jgi:amidase
MLAGATASAQPASKIQTSSKAPFSVVEASVADMRKALDEGRVTSRELVTQYLIRIATYEDKLHAAITVNPKALEEADARDRERVAAKAAGKTLSPMHGIPIALKDNVLTKDLTTTGGALAFTGYVPPYDATLVKNLREAGVILMAKTGMTELANFIAGAPTPMPGNYNAVGGFGMNPYDPRRDPREGTNDGRPVLGTGGSSSGIGTAANFWAANVGSETSGSILSPSNQNMLAGIKPTVGRVSRYGVIPITADQDIAGPMAKTVTDVAMFLGALESGSPDPNDDATKRCTVPANRDYRPFLRADSLKGARIGIPRTFFYDPVTPPNAKAPRGGLNPDQVKAMQDAIAVLKAQGAVIVDPVEIPSMTAKDPANNFLSWGSCGGANDSKGKDADCSVVLKYGMKRDFNKFLASLGDTAPVKTLTELRMWNLAHTKAGAIRFGQSNLDVSDEMDLEADKARYEADRAKDIRLSATEGIDAAMKANNLDALLFPGASGAGIAAKPGYPTVIVPFAMVPNAPNGAPFPAGFDAKPAPYGVSFTGMACSEPKLIGLGYAFEQATKKRVPPPEFP